jgi:hypothetical protein
MAQGLSFDLGSSQLRAVYSGDSVYQSSAVLESYQITLPTTPDFLLAPQVRQLTVQPGSSGTVGLNLASVGGYSGAVNLTCTTSSSVLTCSLNPATVTVNGQATATLTVKAATSGATAKLSPAPGRSGWLRGWRGGAAALALCFVVVFPVRRRRSIAMAFLPTLLAVAFLAGCGGSANGGGGGGSGGGGSNGFSGAPADTYSVLVTATAGGSVHNAVITVVVP